MTNSANSGGWARSPQLRALVATALAISLILGTGFLVVAHLRPGANSIDHPPQPLTDVQTMAQVLEPAKEVVTAAGLGGATGGYMLMSCQNQRNPPYQGAVYLNFDLPGNADTLEYLGEMRNALTASGWAEGLSPNQHPSGHTLKRNGVTVIFYQNPDRPRFGIMALYGECRDMTDHTNDNTAWTDITAQLR